MTKQETTGRANPIQLDREAIEESAARTAYLLAWADAEEREGRTYPGADLDGVAPAETPEPFQEWARDMLTAALGATTDGDGIAAAWARADAEDLGRALALSCGGWTDGLGEQDLPEPVGLPSMGEDCRLWIEPEDARASALAELLGIEPEDVQEATYSENTYDADGGEWLVLTDEEADEAAHDYIRESVWAFLPEFVAGYVPDGIDADTLQAIQGERCEDANAPILALIEAGAGFDDFAADAIAADGRGHFLAQYDGEEREAREFYVYRAN